MGNTQESARESAWQKLNETTLVDDDTDVYRGMRWAFKQGYAAAQASPVDIQLWCPNCFEQHVDEAKPDVCETCGLSEAEHIEGEMSDEFTAWLNPDHKSHRCNFCNHVWRPSDHPTNGVLKLETEGSNDKSAKPVAFANGKDFDDAVKIATQHLASHWHKIEDGLPEPDSYKKYWLTVKDYREHVATDRFVIQAMRFPKDWMSVGGYTVQDVIAWMPCEDEPEPFTPEPEAEGE